MELLDVIRNRRAVREFADQAVDPSVIQALLDAAIQAPSAMNLQPWAFAVVTNAQKISEFGRRAKTWLEGNASSTDLSREALEVLKRPGFTIFYHAPALVMVLATGPSKQASEDCCLAAQNLMLAARDKGLGTCWIGFARPWLDLPETKKELGLPSQYCVVAPIIVGHPREWPHPHGRKPAEVHWLK